MNIPFVCTGNICRSPAGEAVLRRMAEAAGLGDGVALDPIEAGCRGIVAMLLEERQTA